MGELKTVSMRSVRPNKVAMRSVNRESEDYKGMMASLKKHGFLGAIIVREQEDWEGVLYYEIIDGLHRYQACKDLGIEWIHVDIMDLTDDQVLEAQIMASAHRVETKPVEYALQLKRILTRDHTLTCAELACRLGKSPTWIKAQLSLASIENDAIIELIDDGRINLTNAYALAKLPPKEQVNWVDRAMCTQPQEFVPQVNMRVKELSHAARRARLEREGLHADGISGRLARQAYENKVLGDMMTTPTERAAKELKAAFEASKIKAAIAEVKDASKKKSHDDDALAMALALAASRGNPCTEITLKPSDASSMIPNKVSGIHSQIHDEVVVDKRSAYELLHGRPKLQEVRIKYTVKMDTEPKPLERKGWDVVTQRGPGKFDYCIGAWLVHFTGVRWTINHLDKPRLSNLSFSGPVEAMEWIEENFNV